jgi:methionine synthase II (cobalamin-independent)
MEGRAKVTKEVLCEEARFILANVMAEARYGRQNRFDDIRRVCEGAVSIPFAEYVSFLEKSGYLRQDRNGDSLEVTPDGEDVVNGGGLTEFTDPKAAAQVIAEATVEVVKRQVAAGVDVVSDGEMSKISYATYVADRFTGFAGDTPRDPGQDLVEFPQLLEKLAKLGSTAKYRRPRCVGEIRTRTLEPIQEDLRNFARGVSAGNPADAFLNAASPGVIALFQPNDFYKTPDEYLEAVAEALRVEYEAIVAAGFLVQIDAPDLGMGRHTMYRNASVGEYLARAEQHVEVLNHALRNIPGSRVRMHCCWGNYEGPHHHDVPMQLIHALLRVAPHRGAIRLRCDPHPVQGGASRASRRSGRRWGPGGCRPW